VRSELAQQVADHSGPPGFERVEATKGYLNLFFSTSEYTQPGGRDQVLEKGKAYGCAPPRASR
jgi:arginyl-tRNA synthetase